MFKILKLYPVFVLLVLLLPSVWALFVPGFYGASDDLHIGWLQQMDRSLRMGQIPPRFVPDLSFGFGYPLFNFVFPLPFYMGEIFHLLGLSFVDSVKAVFGLSLLASGLAMYFLMRNFCGKVFSVAAAVIYVFTPYRSTDVYVRGAIGESLAFVFFPLIVLSVFKMTDTKNYLRWLGSGSLFLAGLILSHNISAYMFLPFVFILATLKVLMSPQRGQSLFRVCAFFMLGFLVSAYFWVPAILESSLMKYDTVFEFRDHFPTLKQLLIPNWGYGASVPGPGDGMSFFIGTVNLVLVFVSLISVRLLRKKIATQDKLLIVWAVVSFLASFWMMNFRSSPAWETVPLVSYFQFPWRFLTMTTFTSSILVIILKYLKFPKASILVILSVIFLNFSFFRPHDFLGRKDDYYLDRYVPYPQAKKEYLEIQEEYLRLPGSARLRPDKLYPRVFSNDQITAQISIINPLDARVSVNSESGGVLNYNKYLFPGWSVKMDGQAVKPFPGQPFGQISLTVPPGEHVLDFRFEETTLKLALDSLSVMGLLGALFLVVNRCRKKCIS